MTFLQKHHRLVFYGFWIMLGLMQSALTELQDDEAYYWVFSKYPDWGYFDHPPLTAILIKAGYAIFPNEFGVRLFPFLLHVLTLLLLDKLTGKKNPALFYSMALSIAILQLSGFLAVPDTSLIFSTALFFFCYKKFIHSNDFLTVLLLAVSSALLLYSKYQGALVILFVVMSNLQLLKSHRIYIAGLIAFLLFLPHLVWQINHGWVTIRYHLFESNVNQYEIGFTLSYLAGQFLSAGPIVGFILIPAAFLYKPRDKFEKALRFTLIGIYVFFLVSSLRGKVEMNWTAPVLVPLFILAFHFLDKKTRWSSLLIKILPLSLFLILAGRLIMIADIVPFTTIQKRYHAWKEWPQEMKIRTTGLPVVFSNSYQRASKYWFYSGQMTFSQNLYKEHRNQYNFWPVEDSLVGKPVYYADIYDLHRFPDSVKTAFGWVGYRFDSSFKSFSKMDIVPVKNEYKTYKDEMLSINATVSISPIYRELINIETGSNSKLLLAVFNKKGWVRDIETGLDILDLLSQKISLNIDNPLDEGKYTLMFAIQTDGYFPVHAGPRFDLRVE